MALNPYLQLPEGPPVEEATSEPQGNVREQAAEMLQQSGAAPRPGMPGAPPSNDDFLKRLESGLPKPPVPKESVFGGVGKAIAGGAAEFGHQITGLAAYAGNQIAPGSAVSKGLNWANDVAGQSAQDWQESMTPQDRDLMARQWTTLDPHQTIWQGGPHDFIHSLTLQMGQAAPSTLAMLLPMGVMAKAGMVNGALAYVGATQTGLSIGAIANNIQQEIASRDDNTLRQQSPAFAQMLDKGMDPAAARQELTAQASKYAPVVGGLVSGAVATLAGRFLTPVLTGQAGAGMLRRAGLGFADQALQGAGIGGADYVARETAAHTYDNNRAPDLVGGLKAAGESAAAQGVIGAGFAVTHGRSGPLHTDKAPNQPEAAEIHSTMANSPENKASGAAPENHVSGFQQGEESEYQPIERNREGETLTGEQTSAEQRLEPEQQQLPFGPAQDLTAAINAHFDRGAGGEVPHWGQEQELYRGAPPTEPPPPPPPGGGAPGMQEANGPQGNLDLRAGQMNPPRPGPTPPVPAPAQLNLPLRQNARGGPQFPPVAEPPRTVADQLRARAASTPQDMNQPDLFRDQRVPGQLTTRGNRPTIQGNPEGPGARPFSDIEGQVNELSDPQHSRAGVFLSGDTVASLRRSGLLERVRDGAGPEAVPLVNFDGKGGALIAKNQATADELTRLRDQKVGTPEEVIEHATGETQHPIGPEETLRRSRLTGLENEVQQRAATEKETARAVSKATEPTTTVADRLRAAASRDLATGENSPAISREEAARRITAEAQRIHNETRGRSWRGIGAPDPRDVDFHSEDLQRQYQDLDHELAGMRVMRNTAADEAGRQHADAGAEVIERRLAEFLRAHPHELKAEQAARAAVRLSPEGVREFVENKRATGRQYVQPRERVNVAEFKPRERVSRSQVHQMDREELESRYQEVLDRTSRTKEEVAAEAERRVGETPEGEQPTPPKGMTREQMLAADEGKRSLMEKRINRYYRTEAEYEARGLSNAKSDKMAVSPRRSLTEREEQLNRGKTKGQKKLVGYKTFNPEHLMATVESQREMEMSTRERGARIKQRTALKIGVERAVASGEKALNQLIKLPKSDMARGYLRQILQYGRALRDGSMKGSDAMAAAKQFNAHIDHLAKMEPQKRAHYLEEAYNTELKRQNLRASGANPERMARVGELTAHYAAPEGSSSAGTRLDVGGTKPFSAERSTGHQTNLPFEERVQPKTGYTGERARTEPLTEAETDELRNLIGKEGPKQYKLALRGGQAEPQGTTLEVGNLSQWQGRNIGDMDLQRSPAASAARAPGAYRRAAQDFADRLEANTAIRGHEAIDTMLRELPEGSFAHSLFKNLRDKIDPRTVVGWKGATEFSKPDVLGNTKIFEQGPRVAINRDQFEYLRAQGLSPEQVLIHTLGHELVHVATAHATHTNLGLRAELEGIRQAVKAADTNGEHYGTRNVDEMVAEAFSNPKFQRFMDSVRIENRGSLWDRFKSFVARVLGREPTAKTMSAMEAVMRTHDQLFGGKTFRTRGHEEGVNLNLEHDKDGAHVGNALDRAMKSANFVKKLYSNATEGAGQAGLSAMTPRQQSAQFSKYFERADGSNPYKRYWDTFFARASDNALSMERVGKLSNHWSNLEEQFGIDKAASLSRIMHDATIYGFHPDLAPGAPENEHVTGANLARAAEARKQFEALPAEMQAHYGKMRDYYANEQRNTTDQIVLNALHAMLTKGEDAAMSAKDFDAKYDADAVRRLNLDTQDGLHKEFGDSLSQASQDMLAKIGKLSQSKGPYFPLMRNGDYIVTAKRQIANKEFGTSAEAQAFAREQRGNDPTLAVKVNHDEEEGTYRVSVTEKEVRMAQTKSEAAEHRKELAARYGDEATSPVQLKAEMYKTEGSITTGSALDSIMRKLEGNPAAQNAIKEFYLRSLGEQSFRKRELSRANVRGVDIENQHRSFAQYGRSQSYYLSQLKFGRHLANAQGEVNESVRNHRDESQVSAVRMGEFARELALRDEISRNPYQVSDLVRKGSSLTQFYMLTSPSHWFVRAAQPYMLTAPWLGARHGMGESMDALVRAQKMIASPLLNESVESGLGMKALFSRAAAEKTYSVLDQVMSHLTKQGADPKINAMIQHLRNNNLIDLSMATELADISKGKSTGLASRVLDAGRAMLHIAEVNNRVMTAIAARELGLKQGMTEAQAVEHAADAINVTHNDYSYGNTPRLFMAQSKGLLGGARPLMFQFMKYPQQVYGMMISSGLAALKGKTAAERQVGLRTLSGVLLTHMLAAGAIGATIQPVKWAIGALMAGASALGLTDQPYTVASALSGDTYDHELRSVANELFGTDLGELVSKGLPAAAGIDLSQRMALGSTYQFHLKTDSDASTLGSLMETFGGPWLNVAENFYDSGKSFLAGNIVKGIEQMTPHVIRDLVKGGAMAQQGVVDNAGRSLIPADKLSGPEIFAQSLGFRPEQVAEVQDRNNAERTALANIQDQRKTLIQKYVSAEPLARADVRQEVNTFNQQHPGFRLDYATLQRATVAHQVAERELQQYGVRLKGRQLPEIAAQGAAYNVK